MVNPEEWFIVHLYSSAHQSESTMWQSRLPERGCHLFHVLQAHISEDALH